MIGLLVCFGGLLAAGLFFLAADLLRLPYLKTSKAMINTGRENRKATKSLETYLLSLAVKLAPYIHMDEYKRGRQKNILKASGLNMEPEVYQAYVISKAGLVMLGVIPCLLVFPLLALIVVVLAVMILLALIFRAAGVCVCMAGTALNKKERLFTVIAYLPKATVQAAIGSVPMAMGLSCGQIVLSVAVLAILITAPLGAIGMDVTYRRLLKRQE